MAASCASGIQISGTQNPEVLISQQCNIGNPELKICLRQQNFEQISMTTMIRFDDSLHDFVSVLVEQLDEDTVLAGRIVRDAFGRLTFVASNPIASDKLSAAIQKISLVMKPYVNSDRVILTPDHPGATRVLADRRLLYDSIWLDDKRLIEIAILDRRIVGADWLDAPSPQRADGPPYLVFTSLKGGVGRSTAIAVLAAHLAANGKDVLVIDLDIEAPGIGTMLLSEDRQPRFGLIDLLVEDGVGGLDDEMFQNCIGVSDLTQGRGLVHVVPATGMACFHEPENVLSKLSRAMVETPQAERAPKSVRSRARAIIDNISGRRKYDAVLINSRAGLAEITATALLGLGADIFLFGVDLPQTFEGLRYLFSHFELLPPPDRAIDWREKIKMIHAKAQSSPQAVAGFRERAYELFANYLYEIDEGEDPFTYNADDPDAPHYSWPIYLDSTFSEFDPIANPTFMQSSVYRGAFGDFLEAMTARLGFEIKSERPA